VPLEEWNDRQLLEAIDRASEDGLDAAALTLTEAIARKVSRRGATASQITSGIRSLLTGRGGRRGRQDAQRVINELGGPRQITSSNLVDPPGGVPRSRSGTLARDIAFDRPGKLKRRVGIARQSAANKYWAVHEFGGVIRGKPWLVFRLLTGEWRKVRQVRIPKRPYIRPTFAESRQRMEDAFIREASRTFGGGA
jgi:hypothetical protein